MGTDKTNVILTRLEGIHDTLAEVKSDVQLLRAHGPLRCELNDVNRDAIAQQRDRILTLENRAKYKNGAGQTTGVTPAGEKSEAKFWGIDIKGPFVKYVAIPVGIAAAFLVVFGGLGGIKWLNGRDALSSQIGRGQMLSRGEAVLSRHEASSNRADNIVIIEKLEAIERRLNERGGI